MRFLNQHHLYLHQFSTETPRTTNLTAVLTSQLLRDVSPKFDKCTSMLQSLCFCLFPEITHFPYFRSLFFSFLFPAAGIFSYLPPFPPALNIWFHFPPPKYTDIFCYIFIVTFWQFLSLYLFHGPTAVLILFGGLNDSTGGFWVLSDVWQMGGLILFYGPHCSGDRWKPLSWQSSIVIHPRRKNWF